MAPVRVGVTTKLICVLSSALLILLSALCYFLMDYFDQHFKTITARQEQMMVSLLAQEIDLKLEMVHQTLIEEAKYFPIKDAQNPVMVQSFLDQQHGLHQIFDNHLFFFDAHGRIVAESPRDEQRIGQDFSHREYIQKTRNMRMPYISEPYFSSQRHKDPAIMFTAPVFNSNGELLGMLAGGVDLMRDNFLGALAKTKIDQSGYFYLFNRNRMMIIHPERNRMLQHDVPLGSNAGFDLAVEGNDGTFSTVTTTGVPMLTTFKHLKTNDWILAVNHAQADLYRPLEAGKRVFAALLAIGAVFAVGLVWILVRYVMRPLRLMTEHVENLEQKSGAARFLPVRADDDLGALSTAFNVMLKENDSKKEALQQREMLYRTLTEFTNDLVFWRGVNGSFIYLSPNCERLIGYTEKELQDNPDILDAMIFSPEAVTVRGDDLASVDDSNLQREVKVTLKNGATRWFSCVLRSIDSESGYNGIRGSLRDITQRREMEEELAYISLHDGLTGLYNRSQFEREMESFRHTPPVALGILVCDLNGLKLLNDTLGHPEGDKMLLKASKLLQKLFAGVGMLARIGGDEFVVLFRNTNQEFMTSVCEIARDALVRANEGADDAPISFACGVAYGEGDTLSADNLFKAADEMMYRDKYADAQTARRDLLYYLVRRLDTLEAGDAGHEANIDTWLQLLAEKAGYSIDKRTHLSVFAKFHDIGKVGVSETIWNKNGPLTMEECLTMQQHVEIGHRIASSVVELMPVADWILKHHEHWDGDGYPLGLAGEQIPEVCRMFAVVEAYEAMTHERPYRQPLEAGEAVRELMRQRGAQFDPRMVDLFLSVWRERDAGEQE